MRLEFVSVTTGQRLDVLDIEGAQIRYRTGRARDIAEPIVRRAGVGALPGWTNGYAAFRRAR
jgi:hypothetical protein